MADIDDITCFLKILFKKILSKGINQYRERWDKTAYINENGIFQDIEVKRTHTTHFYMAIAVITFGIARAASDPL